MALCVVEEAFQLVHAHDTCETVVINPKHTSVFLCPCLSNYILELWNEIFNMCIHPCNFKIITAIAAKTQGSDETPYSNEEIVLKNITC